VEPIGGPGSVHVLMALDPQYYELWITEYPGLSLADLREGAGSFPAAAGLCVVAQPSGAVERLREDDHRDPGPPDDGASSVVSAHRTCPLACVDALSGVP
jgi:hypothetical protein